MISDPYVVRLAQRRDVALLPDIERRAGTRFDAYGLDKVMTEILTSLYDLEQSLAGQRLWVAAAASDRPVGFALACVVDSNAHLDELDVLPEHGRHGIGTALVETVCAWGRANGFKAITLSTLSHIPWNAPFYNRLGFRILPPDELSETLQNLLREEVALGLPTDHRVIMRREL